MKYYFVFRAKETAEPLPLYPRSTGREIFDEGEVMNQTPMDFVEICWVDSGTCEFRLREGTYILHAGDAICRMPMELRHEIAKAPGTTVYWATFDGPGAGTFIRSWGFPRSVMHPGKCPAYLFDAVGRGLLSTSVEEVRKLVSVYSELIALALNGDRTASGSGSLMQECLYRFNKKLSDPEFDINTLADELGVHRVTICRMFKKNLGISPVGYLTGCRVRLGLELLSGTAMTLDEITQKVGLSNSNYFCRLIRRFTNMTPGQYRSGKKCQSAAPCGKRRR